MLFKLVPGGFLALWNYREQLWLKLEKILGFRNMKEKLEIIQTLVILKLLIALSTMNMTLQQILENSVLLPKLVYFHLLASVLCPMYLNLASSIVPSHSTLQVWQFLF